MITATATAKGIATDPNTYIGIGIGFAVSFPITALTRKGINAVRMKNASKAAQKSYAEEAKEKNNSEAKPAEQSPAHEEPVETVKTPESKTAEPEEVEHVDAEPVK